MADPWVIAQTQTRPMHTLITTQLKNPDPLTRPTILTHPTSHPNPTQAHGPTRPGVIVITRDPTGPFFFSGKKLSPAKPDLAGELQTIISPSPLNEN